MRARVVVVRHNATGRELRFMVLDTIKDIAGAIRHARRRFRLPMRALTVQMGVSREQ